MRSTWHACVLWILAVAVGAPLAAAELEMAWVSGWKAAERKARAERRPLLVDFWAEWCEWCHELDRTTYRDPRVVELSKGFVPVKVDAEGGLGEMAPARARGAAAARMWCAVLIRVRTPWVRLCPAGIAPDRLRGA